jgi:hypothetical protein
VLEVTFVSERKELLINPPIRHVAFPEVSHVTTGKNRPSRMTDKNQ